MAGISRKQAPVNSVTASFSIGGSVQVNFDGYMPDPAWTLEPLTHRVEGNTIIAELWMNRPEDAMAACVIVDYQNQFNVDVHDWAPGHYNVSVNGQQAEFTI